MTLESRLQALATAIGTDIKTLTTSQGSLTALNTSAKGSLVAALNEVLAIAMTGGTAGYIDDEVESTSTTTTYSASKITALIQAGITQVVGGASSAYDTLLEIQTMLQGEDTAIATLLTAVGNRVRFDAAQTLATAQILQACTNIGIGNPDSDFLATYTTAKT